MILKLQAPNALEAFREKSFNIVSSWPDFYELCSTFVLEARSQAMELASFPTRRPVPNRPSAKKPPIGRVPSRNTSNEAKRLHSRYSHSKKRATRLIIGDESPTFSGSTSDVESFF